MKMWLQLPNTMPLFHATHDTPLHILQVYNTDLDMAATFEMLNIKAPSYYVIICTGNHVKAWSLISIPQ